MESEPRQDCVVVAHQPNFLPWLGYFYKMTYADVFVILDEVQYSKGSFTNRVTIKQNDKPSWLTVPVTLPSSKVPISAVEMHPSAFVRKHLKTIEQVYGKCPHFTEVFDIIRPHYERVGTSLAAFNRGLIASVVDYLESPCRFVLQSELGIGGRNNEMLAEIVRAVGGTLYVSGRGARKYMVGEEHVYLEQGLEIAYQVFKPPEYAQAGREFVSGCSIIDVLFNLGKDAREVLRPQADPPYEIWRGEEA